MSNPDFTTDKKEAVRVDVGKKVDDLLVKNRPVDTKEEPIVDFTPVEDKGEGEEDYKKSVSRVKFADEIRNNPPKPGYMEVGVKPAIYSIDLNTDAHWWFTHVCTVFPLLLDQAKRTHIDIKDSFKPERRLPDFNYMFIFIAIIGFIGVFVLTKFFGWW